MALLHSGAEMVIASGFAVSRLASVLLAVGLYAEIAGARPPHIALARTQEWIALSTYEEKALRVDQLATALGGAGREAGALRKLAGLLRTMSGRRASLAEWCLFMAYC